GRGHNQPMEARRSGRIGFLTDGEKCSAAEINPLNDRQLARRHSTAGLPRGSAGGSVNTALSAPGARLYRDEPAIPVGHTTQAIDGRTVQGPSRPTNAVWRVVKGVAHRYEKAGAKGDITDRYTDVTFGPCIEW